MQVKEIPVEVIMLFSETYAASAGTLTGSGNITLGQSAGRNLAQVVIFT